MASGKNFFLCFGQLEIFCRAHSDSGATILKLGHREESCLFFQAYGSVMAFCTSLYWTLLQP